MFNGTRNALVNKYQLLHLISFQLHFVSCYMTMAGGIPGEILSSLGNGFVDKMEHIVSK
jgi:hypothetical protein